MKVDQCLIFYNPLNIDIPTVESFYKKIKKYYNSVKPIDIINQREMIKLKEFLKKIESKELIAINLGGDGSLFTSLSFLANLVEQQIYTISFNFGNKGFYCFYEKSMFYNFIESKFDLMEKINSDYYNNNFIQGYFWNFNEINYFEINYFVADIVIKPYNSHKAINLSFKIEDMEIEEKADGIICFTTFGSTGYFLSLNGIYLDSDFKDLVGISFIAPHSLKHRPLILKNKSVIIKNKDNKRAVLITDGQERKIIEPKEQIIISKSNKSFILLGNKSSIKRWFDKFILC